MNEWVKRLNELRTYWKARVADDVRIKANMFKANKDNESEDDEIASIRNNGLHEHFNNFKSYVDPLIWNFCVLNGCRSLTVYLLINFVFRLFVCSFVVCRLSYLRN